MNSFVMEALLSKTDSPVRDLYRAKASKPAKLSILDAYLDIKTKIRVAHLDQCKECESYTRGWSELHYLEWSLDIERNYRRNLGVLEVLSQKRRYFDLKINLVDRRESEQSLFDNFQRPRDHRARQAPL